MAGSASLIMNPRGLPGDTLSHRTPCARNVARDFSLCYAKRGSCSSLRGGFSMCFTWITLVLAGAAVCAEPAAMTYSTGVAKMDITPAYPVRLSGFGFRRTESEGVTQRIWARALVIDDGEPAVLLTVDNLGLP